MNFGTPVPLIIGVVLIVGAILLFFLGKIKPGYQRDSDAVYAILGLIAGVILLAHLGMDFTQSFQQMIVVGMLVALMIENIQARSPNRQQSSRPVEGGTFRNDDYRPSRYRSDYSERSRSEVRAELDDFAMDEPSPRRIRGSRDAQRSRSRDAYGQDSYAPDSYAPDPYGSTEDPRPRRRPRSDYSEEASASSRDQASSRRRPPLQLRGEAAESNGDRGTDTAERRPSRSSTRTVDDARSARDERAARSRRRRKPRSERNEGDGDYVDYKPLDLPKYPGPKNDDEVDNSGNFDDDLNFR